jgi:hypothetical protein
MKPYLLAPIAALALGAPLFVTRDASACGGCYHRPSETETTVVTGHKMVLSVSMTQTVLWDQIEYDGDPSEFAWVLPVKQGARVELATDAWFEMLDAATVVNVVSPPLDCAPAPSVRSGGGCGSADALAEGSSGSGFPQDSVTVVHRGTVGPYETVTLATDTPGALNTWLDMHGYAVDAEIQPIIDAYVAEGFDFIALRLQPGQGVRAMKPVRVVTPGASPTLPLRMVAAGTGPFVGITLFVVTEGRFATKNFPTAAISESDIAWDHLTIKSNYAELRQATLESNQGRTWLTAYAKQGALLSPVNNPTSFGPVTYATGQGQGWVETIGQAYIDQAVKNGEVMNAECDHAFIQHANSGLVVKDPCPPNEQDPTMCPAVGSGEINANDFACGPADDLAVALNGLHPRDVWLTRLDAFLPRAALATDLELEAAKDQSTVENWITPGKVLNETEACRKALDESGAPVVFDRTGRGGRPWPVTAFALATSALALLAVARRLRRSTSATPVR